VCPEERRFAEVAAGLTNRELIRLVARQAGADRYFAALLQVAGLRVRPARIAIVVPLSET
jgi:hypothetical protein